MSEFDKMCQEAEDIDWETRCRIVKGKSEEILPLLERKSVDGVDGKEILATFLFSAMAADNRLTEEEYALLYPLLSSFLGDNINFDDAKRAFISMRKESRELKKVTQDMISVIADFSEDLRKDIVLVLMIICAADGKITLSEKVWLRSLLF